MSNKPHGNNYKRLPDGTWSEMPPWEFDRKHAYPDIGDQLDAIWKAITGLKAQGTTFDKEVDEVLSQVESVKVKYPKT